MYILTPTIAPTAQTMHATIIGNEMLDRSIR